VSPMRKKTPTTAPTHPRELLFAAMLAYRAADNPAMAEILEALATADTDEAVLSRKGGPRPWARGRLRDVVIVEVRDDAGEVHKCTIIGASMMAGPTRAEAVRGIIGVCTKLKGHAVPYGNVNDRDHAIAADEIASIVATKWTPLLDVLGVPPSKTAATVRATYRRRIAIVASLMALRKTSRAAPELMAVATLRGLGLSDARARSIVRTAMATDLGDSPTR